jgi:hypothetical protein
MDFSNLERLSRRLGNNGFVLDSSLIYEINIIKGYVHNIKHEVLEELMINNVNRIDFLNYIISEIEPLTILQEHFVININNCLEVYNVTIENILNDKIDNPLFRYLVTSNYKEIPTSNPNRESALSIQIAFYDYFSKYFEDDLILFLESKRTVDNVNQIEKTKLNQISELDVIFKSEESFQIFNFLLEKFAISEETSNRRGMQAKLNAIWGCPSSHNKIFREHTELKAYIAYLNKIFNLKYNSRTMSDGYNYHITIQKWLIE